MNNNDLGGAIAFGLAAGIMIGAVAVSVTIGNWQQRLLDADLAHYDTITGAWTLNIDEPSGEPTP